MADNRPAGRAGKSRDLGLEMCPWLSCGYGKLGSLSGRERRALESCGDGGPWLGWAPGKPAPAACIGSSAVFPAGRQPQQEGRVAAAAPPGLGVLGGAPWAPGARLRHFRVLLSGSLSCVLSSEGTRVSCCCRSFSLAAAWAGGFGPVRVVWGVLKFGISRGRVSLGGRGAPSARGAGGSALVLDLFQEP